MGVMRPLPVSTATLTSQVWCSRIKVSIQCELTAGTYEEVGEEEENEQVLKVLEVPNPI